jgi:hypothetical protein
VSQKESRSHHIGGRFEIASIDFINSVLAEDRYARENHAGVRLYLDSPSPSLPTAAELLDQIDQKDLDPTQQLLIQALEKQASTPFTNGEQQVASAVTTHEAVSKYKNTPIFRKHVASYQDLRSEGVTYEDRRARLAGAIFADIAESAYRPSITDGVLLSDEATYLFFSELMDEKMPIENPYGSRALLGVTVPDGMVVGVTDHQPTLLRFVEYSIAMNDSKFSRQYSGYEKAFREIGYKSPDGISGDFGVDFVVPRRAYGREYPALEGDIEARYHYLDQIDSVSFGHEIDAILSGQKASNLKRNYLRY